MTSSQCRQTQAVKAHDSPIFSVGDKVTVVSEFPKDLHFGVNANMRAYLNHTVTIKRVIPGKYTPSYIGEDGCEYFIEEDENFYSWPSTAFVLNIKSKTLNYEDQLHEKGVAISRGDGYTGSIICCRRCKTAVTVGHLSNKEISGM